MKKPLYIILGQTATGKTSLAIDLAQKVGGELINTDSRQCYKHLDIVTGKDVEQKNFNEKELFLNRFSLGYYSVQGIPIWLYDVVAPQEYFSAQQWSECAKKTITLFDSQVTPIFVGGTYFYMSFLLDRDHENVSDTDWVFRKNLEKLDREQLQERLMKLNKETYLGLNNSDVHNKRRLIRWIEKETEKAPIVKPQKNLLIDKYDIRMIGLYFEDKELLRQKITQRVEDRLNSGAVEEAQMILAMGYKPTDPGLVTLGYREILSYLEGKCSYDEMKFLWITHECQYAKRQRTFMKKDDRITWFAVDKMSLHEVLSRIYTSPI